MKKHLFIFYYISLILTSCAEHEIENSEGYSYLQSQDNIISEIEQISSMLYFNSTTDFFQTFHKLLTETEDFQFNWATNKHPEALLSNIETCSDSIMLSMPKAFQALFNKDLKVNINDSIIQYNQGNLYVTSIKNRELTSPILCGNGNVDLLLSPNTRQTIGHVGFEESRGLNHQHEFKRSQSKYKYKYVNQLRGYRIVVNRQNSAILSFMIKFEYKYSAGWKNAGLPRNIAIQLGGDVSVSGPILEYQDLFSWGGSEFRYNNITSSYEIPLAKVIYDNNLNNWNWNINISGHITQSVIGENDTSWIDTW